MAPATSVYLSSVDWQSCVKPLDYNTFLKNALNACAFHCQHNRCKQYFPSPSIYFGDGPRDQKRIYCVK